VPVSNKETENKTMILPIVCALIAFLAVAWLSLGAVYVRENRVGLVIKRFASRNLPPGALIALNGEAGYQADALAPGLHWLYWKWQYRIVHAPVTQVPAGGIALVLAHSGADIPPGRILASCVDCDNFQDARAFLTRGGEKGRQLGILTAGTYRINPALFDIITEDNCSAYGVDPASLRVLSVERDRVGIVTTLDGAPIPDGEIAGPVLTCHDNFQDSQAFLTAGGSRGLQEQVLLSGQWNINPWFARVEQVPMVEIPIGHVGVVISYVGRPNEDVSGAAFKHGNLVHPGHKGVWVTPLLPGKHPLNTRIMKVELVPTTNIVLNWANRTEAHSYDQKLSSVTVRSRDGFAFSLDVAQIIHVGANDAPKVISRVGAMQNLIDHVLQPIVGNYFRNSAQDFTVLDFLGARSSRQADAAGHIRRALGEYDVQAIDTLIGDITPPEELMKTQTERKIAEEREKTYAQQENAEKQRQSLVRQTSLADIQSRVVSAEQGVNIAELTARAAVRQAEGDSDSTRVRAVGESEAIRLRAGGEAEAIRATGAAKAEAYRSGVEALGPQAYALIQLMQIVGERGVRITPDVSVQGGGDTSRGLLDGLLGLKLREEVTGAAEAAPVLAKA
jgi:uncharacterized membrane protein YqiK